MNKIKINSWTTGIFIIGIILLVIMLKVVNMQLIYAIPIGIGFTMLILIIIYAINQNW